jgi:hypothetical protein
VFLPVGDLPGLEAAELAAAAADKESKAALALINQIYETLSPGLPLTNWAGPYF